MLNWMEDFLLMAQRCAAQLDDQYLAIVGALHI